MYFAAGLFITTGMVGVVISLLTPPPREYMVSFSTDLQIIYFYLPAGTDDLQDKKGPESSDG